MRLLLTVLTAAVPAYILGSMNGAIIVARLLYKKDIRDFGSGNPGLTNFYRVFGKGGALLVAAIDIIKTVAPVLLGGWVFRYSYDMLLFGQCFSGLFVMLGHCFPLFYRFKGGKGVMAAGVILIIIDWRIAIVAWGTFIIITILTRYVSLGALIGSVLFPPAMLVIGIGGTHEFVAVALCAVLLIIRHQANIGRLISGKESRLSFKKKHRQT